MGFHATECRRRFDSELGATNGTVLYRGPDAPFVPSLLTVELIPVGIISVRCCLMVLPLADVDLFSLCYYSTREKIHQGCAVRGGCFE